MKIEDITNIKTPFNVICKVKFGDNGTVIGFSDNDPLGVGGGGFHKNPTVYFEGGGWILLSDLLRYYELAPKEKTRVTKKEREVLEAMHAGEELVQSLPGGWWLEDHQIAGRVGWSLLRKVLISEVQGSAENFIRYYINEWGRRSISKDEAPNL